MTSNTKVPFQQMPKLPQNLKLAHAYVPIQYLFNVYPPEKGLMQGSIFPELVNPYYTDNKDITGE